jgi:acetylornithine deacetylase/succinyl-diaminopimelate desuccinylase-like protein
MRVYRGTTEDTKVNRGHKGSRPHDHRQTRWLWCLFLSTTIALQAQTGPNDCARREIYKELVEINTTDTPAGNVTKAAEAMAARLKAAGFPAADIQVLGPDPKKGNLVLRWRAGAGASRKPILLLAHLDVVEAKREDWSFDPFTFLEKDGFFYGRGTSDDKAMAAQFVANLIRLKQEGFTSDRDVILALTADEEGGTFNGVDWLVKNHKNLIDAEFAVNEGGGGNMRKGKYLTNEVQASEKVFQDFHLEVTNPGGHSSLPVKDNAIYHLAGGLARLAAFDFPVQMNEVTRGYFERSASVQDDPKMAADMRAVARPTPDAAAAARLSAAVPFYNSLMRTDLRRHAPPGRPRQQCIAPDGGRQRELPHPARRLAGVGQGQARRSAGGSSDQGVVRGRRESEQAVTPSLLM